MKFLDAIKLNPTISISKEKVCPFISMENVDFHSREPLAYEMKAFSSGVKFEDGDTVVARITPCLQNGKSFYCKDIGQGFGSTEFLVFRPQNKEVDNSFLYYYLSTFNVRQRMINSMVGATGRQRVNNDVFKSMEVDFPDITTQRRIADILSAYDDLIENNRKQIKLLEEAAQRLYKEWFVDLRFPGHEKVEVTDGVPEGWEKSKAKDFFDISIGRTPARVHREWYSENIGLRWVSISDMCDGVYIFETKEKLTEEALEQNRIVALPIGTVLLSFKLTVGRVSISSVPLYSNEAIAHFYTDNMDFRVYTFLYLKNYDYETLGSTSGIGKAINSTIIKNMPFLKPSSSILEKFGRIAGVYFEQIALKEKQIKILQEARDRLLPKLMSGEIEV